MKDNINRSGFFSTYPEKVKFFCGYRLRAAFSRRAEQTLKGGKGSGSLSLGCVPLRGYLCLVSFWIIADFPLC